MNTRLKEISMCYRKTMCPFYGPNSVNNSCMRCVHIAKAKRTAKLSQIAFVTALISFVIVTYLLYA